MRRWGSALLVAVFACSLSGCWLQVGGNAGRTGFVTGETSLTASNASGLHQAWKVRVSTLDASSPLLDRGKVYVATGAAMTALNAWDGSQAWQVDRTSDQFPPMFGQPAIAHGSLIAGWIYASVGGLAAFDEDTGALSLGGSGGPGSWVPYNAPAVTNGAMVYDELAISSAGAATAIDLGANTGFITFSQTPGGVPPLSDPMVSGTRAFVSSGNSILAFALDSCPPALLNGFCGSLWSTNLPAAGGMPVALSSTQVAVPLANGNVAVLDQTTGALQWTAVTGSTAAQSPVIDGSNIYVGTGDGRVRAFAAVGCGNATCTPVWASAMSAGAAISSQPVYAGGVVYVGTAGGALAAFDASNGARLAYVLVDAGSNHVNVVENGGTVYVSTSSGVVGAYRP